MGNLTDLLLPLHELCLRYVMFWPRQRTYQKVDKLFEHIDVFTSS